ncbi:MAG: LicD family protein [Candidatus Hodarchaeales archaeon]
MPIRAPDKEFLRLLLAIKKACGKTRWFMTCGTLLGAVRDGDFIAWDHDIDCGCLLEDFSHIDEMAESLKRDGYTARRVKMLVAKRLVHFIQINTRHLSAHISFNYEKGIRQPQIDKLLNEPAPMFRIQGHYFPAPVNPDEYLEWLYGDWTIERQNGDPLSRPRAWTLPKNKAPVKINNGE